MDTQENILASRWSRLFASVIDSLIIALITLPTMYLTGGFEQINDGIEPSYTYNTLIGLVGLLGFYLINVKLLLTKGQTIGKKLFNIKIVDLDNNLPTKKHLLNRYSVYFIPTYIPIVGTIFSIINILFIFGKKKQCIHDLVGKTRVINI